MQQKYLYKLYRVHCVCWCVVNNSGKTKTIRVKDKSAIANAMNKQFTEIGGNLAKKLQQTHTIF